MNKAINKILYSENKNNNKKKSAQVMKKQTQHGLFDEEEQIAQTNKEKDPLVRLSMMVNWEKFRPVIEKAIKKKRKAMGAARRMII